MIDHFGFGKAVGRLFMPSDHATVTAVSKTKLRFVDKVTGAVLVEFDSVLLN